jgi:hypothetical protein
MEMHGWKPDAPDAPGMPARGAGASDATAATMEAAGSAPVQPPPLLIGATLMFWGWQTGHWVVAVVLAVVLEAARWVRVRWEFSDEDFRRIWALCSVFLLVALFWAFTANDGPSAFGQLVDSPGFWNQRRAGQVTTATAASVFRWLPLLMFPLAVAQAYSNRNGLTLSTISLLVRRHRRRLARAGVPLPPEPRFHSGYLYFGGCLAGACMQPVSGGRVLGTLVGLACLLGWALWPLRSRRYGVVTWVAVVLLAAAVGVAGQFGLWNLQRYIGGAGQLGEWLAGLRRTGAAPDLNTAQISWEGLAPWKLSTRIAVRLEVLQGPAPAYLRQGVYRLFMPPYWLNGEQENAFMPVNETPPESGNWPLVQQPEGSAVVRVVTWLHGRKDESRAGVLPLPPRTVLLRNFPAFSVERHPLGAVLVTGPGMVVFEAVHQGSAGWESPPEPDLDLGVPENLVPVLDSVIAEMGLPGRASWAVARPALTRFFEEKFQYRLWQPRPRYGRREQRPLEQFLLQSRAGHCEYFATATVLLLRRLGIPARYTVGYAVHEGSGRRYVVRDRDAHAWCQVWNAETGRWEDFDTTPADWIAQERTRESGWLWWQDFWSWIRYQVGLAWWGYTRLRQYLLWFFVPVLAVLLVQVMFRRGRRRTARSGDNRGAGAGPGLDSEFYELERWLAARGWARQPHEPPGRWLRRVRTGFPADLWTPAWEEALRLHYRYRFDPRGLEPADRERLRLRVRECLQTLRARRRLPVPAGV